MASQFRVFCHSGTNVSELSESASAADTRRPGWISVLTAPLLGVVRLPRAASTLARASAIQLLILTPMYVAFQMSLCVGMSVWEHTVQYEYSGHGARQRSPWWDPDANVGRRSMADVWQEWVALGEENPAIFIAFGVGLATLAGMLASIALYWPRVHRHGLLRATLRRTHAAVLASCGIVSALTVVVFTCYILVDHHRKLYSRSGLGGIHEEHIAVVGILSGIVVMIYGIGRATRAVSAGDFTPELPPQCEGCGYDLTHRPESGLCPECGMSVDKSLTPGLRRKPADFDKAPSLADAISTSIGALFTPGAFYSRLTMRTGPQRDAAFRVRHHAAILIGAATWITTLICYDIDHRSLRWDDYLGIFAGSMGATIGGWTVQHAVGGIVCLVWFIRGSLPDMRWGLRVINYDTVYLWLFCLFNGSMITSFVMFEDWIGDQIGRWNRATGVPTAVLAMAIPNLTLIGYWFVRLFRGGQAVRWANF